MVIVYLVVIAWFVGHQRESLVQIVRDIDNDQLNQRALASLATGIAHSIYETDLVLRTPGYTEGHPLSFADLAEHFQTASAELREAAQVNPSLTPESEGFKVAAALMHGAPRSEDMMRVRDTQQRALQKLQDILTVLQIRNTELMQQYRNTQQYISVFAISSSVAAAVACIAVILVFFTRLAKDIKALQDRAVAIVGGYAGEPLPKTRNDEIGGLIEAVNRMQVDLRRWESRQEIERQQRFHQEKMAAIGSLAAAVGHEVSNPLAAISGIAQFIVEEAKREERPSSRAIGEFATSILKQTERIIAIMRQMATLTAPHSPKPELLDLNALIESTWSFLSYDKRLRGVNLELNLDRGLPAVDAVADHITQILMNLLINAADAMDHIADPAQRRIRVGTRIVGHEVEISVTDNGRGMTAEVLAKAFDDSFTTKPAGKGRGIGLFICKNLVEDAGGRIALQSMPDQGTTATLRLPLRPARDAASVEDAPAIANA
ncbi:MAG TPA: ATP-binding protein [Casimicrobiaceae bacterium]|nr:ATP-binding protein [Casimicrobiaceae bacterium]